MTLLCGVLLGALAVGGCGGTPQGRAVPTARASSAGHATDHPPGRASVSTFRAAHASAAYAPWRLPFRVARSAVTAMAGDPRRVLLAGGMLPGDASTDQVSELDLTTGRSAAGPRLVTAVHDAAAGTFAGHPAVYGGGNATEQSGVQELRSGRWRLVAQLPTTRSDLSVASVGGRSLVIGGYDGTTVPRSVLTRSGRRLVPVGSLREGVRYAATATVGSDVLVFGGEVDHRELASVQRVDGRTGRTKIVARLPQPLGHAMAAYVGGRVLLMGGRTGSEVQTDLIWWFDPETGSFTRAGRLPRPLSDASVVSSDRHVWLLGGEDPQVDNRIVDITVS